MTASPATATNETWGNAQEVAAQLNVGKVAELNSVSCSSPGNCGAGGTYANASGAQALVVSESNGTWGTPQEVPGTAALNAGADAAVRAVSCSSPGNCSAGGYYRDASDNRQAFVVTETGGTWGTAREVPGTATLNTGPDAEVTSVSCSSPGNCSAGGFYSTSIGNEEEGFVVDETGGTWRTAQPMPANGFQTDAFSAVTAVSCAAPGDCSAGGASSSGGFVASETDGTWGPAEALPGAGSSEISSMSCPSPGTCGAGGAGSSQALVADETGGTWGNAEELPGIASLNAGLEAAVTSISCTSPDDCTAGGYYEPASTSILELQPFVATEAGGVWGAAEQIPGMGSLNVGLVPSEPDLAPVSVASVSCGSPGDCALGGYYTDANGNEQAYVVDETGGTWDTAQEVPGTAALNAGGYASVNSVSCATGGSCSAVGYYQGANGLSEQAFVVDGEPTLATSTVATLSASKVVYGAEQDEHVTVTVSDGSGETPAGTVIVASGNTTVCTITLASGAGSCRMPATKFGAGTVTATASYGGNSLLGPSVSAAVSFTVSKARSTSSLALSAARVRYGKEHTERVSVRVAPQYGGTPTGTVTIKSGTRSVCAIRLKSGTGSCRLSPRQLRIGRHRLVAAYPGSSDFSASASAGKYLTVAR